MNADLVRLFQFGQPPIKRHAVLTKVTSVSEGENQSAVVRLPVVRVQPRELVAGFDLARPQTSRSKAIHQKNRPDHHGQHDHDYIGRYLDFIFHHRYLRALGKAELCSNSAALADLSRTAGWNYFGGTPANRRCRFPIGHRSRAIISAEDT